MTTIDLTLDDIMIPDLVGYTQPFGTKVQTTEVNLGGLSTAEVNANVLMAFAKMRPTPISTGCDTTRVEYDAKLCFQSLLEETISLTLGQGTYIGCHLSIYNVSEHNQNVINTIGNNTFTEIIEPNSSAEFVWNGTTWVRLLTKIALAQPTLLTSGDIWVDNSEE